MRVIILGGGFIGQLLQAVLWPKARVFDWATTAPKTPTRLLGPQYLWMEVPELPCRRFDVYTTIDGKDASQSSMRAYKKKVEKEQDNSDWKSQFQPRMDGWECTLPINRVEYGKRAVSINYTSRLITCADGSVSGYDVLVSTIPLPTMLTLCGIRSHEFKSRPIYLHRQAHPPNPRGDMLVNYVSYANTPIYRVTYRDGAQHTEALEPFHDIHANEVVRITPGKIYAHPATEKMVRALESVNIYPLGRFARWAPDELAHETLASARHLQGRLCLI